MSVDRCVASRARERLIVTVGDMVTRLRVFVPLAQAEVDHIAGATLVSVSHKEVVRLHVSMQEVVVVHVFEAGDHLVSQHAHSLEGQFTTAILEQIFEGVAEEFHDHGLVVTFNSVPLNVGDALYSKTLRYKHISYREALKNLRPPRSSL